MLKLALETKSLKREFSNILMNIDVFDFEDRKHILRFVGDLNT